MHFPSALSPSACLIKASQKDQIILKEDFPSLFIQASTSALPDKMDQKMRAPPPPKKFGVFLHFLHPVFIYRCTKTFSLGPFFFFPRFSFRRRKSRAKLFSLSKPARPIGIRLGMVSVHSIALMTMSKDFLSFPFKSWWSNYVNRDCYCIFSFPAGKIYQQSLSLTPSGTEVRRAFTAPAAAAAAAAAAVAVTWRFVRRFWN